MNIKLIIAVAAVTGLSLNSKAQADEDLVIQFTGIVVTGDSIVPVPYTTVYSSSRPQSGTISDYFGFFSLAVLPGDTVTFSSVGFNKSKHVIPADTKSRRMSIVQVIGRDTVELPTTFVYPWPSPERLKEEFLALDVPDDELLRAKKNLDPDVLYDRMLEMGMSPNESYRMVMNQQHDKLRYANQAPPIQVLNPIAWAKFIQAWKRGDFKRKD